MTDAPTTLTRRQNVTLLIARLLMASLFLWSGFEKLTDYQGAAAFAAHMGFPFAMQGMALAIVLELACGIMLVTGWHARIAAAVLVVWMAVLGPWFHQFWNAPPALWQLMIDDFFHHFVMIGAMLYVVVFGPGAIVLVAPEQTKAPLR